MKLAFSAIVILLIAIYAAGAMPASPGRSIQPFDADWRFLKGDDVAADKREFDDSSWRRVDVPHDWSIEGPFDAKNQTGGAGGFLPAGIGWYRKHFTVASDKRPAHFYRV